MKVSFYCYSSVFTVHFTHTVHFTYATQVLYTVHLFTAYACSLLFMYLCFYLSVQVLHCDVHVLELTTLLCLLVISQASVGTDEMITTLTQTMISAC